MSASLAKKLKLDSRDAPIEIKGVNQQVSKATRIVDLIMISRFKSFDTNLQCVILQTITQRAPNVRIDRQRLGIPENI